MAKDKESRSRGREMLRVAKSMLLEELDATFVIRLSKEARDMLLKKAQEKGMKPSVLVRQLVYRYLGLIEGEP